jgi:sulfur relay (sulfurtransferase) DsrF/TusC family protein
MFFVEETIPFVDKTTIEALRAAFAKHGVFDEMELMRIPLEK